MEQFKVGDVVMLKSGGPKMTIEKIDGNKAKCTWFTGGKSEWNYFPLDGLQSSTPETMSSR